MKSEKAIARCNDCYIMFYSQMDVERHELYCDHVEYLKEKSK